MAIVSGVGAGSGLDIQALVTQLVQAEAAAPSAAINRREAKTKAQISALGTIKGAFSGLQTALNALKASSLFAGRSIESSSTEFVTAKIGGTGTAVPGTYEIVVDQLALTHKLRNAIEIPTGDDLLTAGQTATLKFSYGAGETDNFEVEVTDASNNNVRELATAINQAADGKGVIASVVSSATGESLVLTAAKSGADNALTITQTAGTGDLSAFTSAELTVLSVAQDSRAFVDGIEVTGSSNTISDAIDGVEFTLKKVNDVDTPNVNLTVTENLDGTRNAIKAFVTAYNAVVDAIGTATSFDVEKKTAAALNGDSQVRGAGDQLRRAFSRVISDAGKAGIDLGISSDLKGKLTFDTAKFDSAYAAAPESVKGLFDGTSGSIYKNFFGFVDALVSSTGTFSKRDESLNSVLKDTTKQREALERRLESVEARYRKQFIALDTLLGKLSTTSNYLAQQLAALPGAGR